MITKTNICYFEFHFICFQIQIIECFDFCLDISCGKGIIIIGNKAWMNQYSNSSTNEYKNFAEVVKTQVSFYSCIGRHLFDKLGSYRSSNNPISLYF